MKGLMFFPVMLPFRFNHLGVLIPFHERLTQSFPKVERVYHKTGTDFKHFRFSMGLIAKKLGLLFRINFAILNIIVGVWKVYPRIENCFYFYGRRHRNGGKAV